MSQDWHQIPSFFVLVDDVVNLSVNAAVNRVDQSIAFAAAGMLEEGRGENALAFRRERDIDWIIHSTRHYGFDNSALGAAAEDVRRAGLECSSFRAVVTLLRECALAPIDPAVQPE